MTFPALCPFTHPVICQHSSASVVARGGAGGPAWHRWSAGLAAQPTLPGPSCWHEGQLWAQHRLLHCPARGSPRAQVSSLALQGSGSCNEHSAAGRGTALGQPLCSSCAWLFPGNSALPSLEIVIWGLRVSGFWNVTPEK